MLHKKIIFLFIILFFSISCSYKLKKDSQYFCKELILSCEKIKRNVLFKTTKGTFEVELFGETNPLTVANFIKNIEDGIYKKKNFYKIIVLPNTKFIHSGLYPDINLNFKNNSSSQNKNRFIPLEIAFKDKKEPNYKLQINDPINLRNLEHYFEKGSISMVKVGSGYSSSTEFFFSLGSSPELDGRYSIFGKVVDGYQTLELLIGDDEIIDIKLLN